MGEAVVAPYLWSLGAARARPRGRHPCPSRPRGRRAVPAERASRRRGLGRTGTAQDRGYRRLDDALEGGAGRPRSRRRRGASRGLGRRRACGCSGRAAGPPPWKTRNDDSVVLSVRLRRRDDPPHRRRGGGGEGGAGARARLRAEGPAPRQPVEQQPRPSCGRAGHAWPSSQRRLPQPLRPPAPGRAGALPSGAERSSIAPTATAASRSPRTARRAWVRTERPGSERSRPSPPLERPSGLGLTSRPAGSGCQAVPLPRVSKRRTVGGPAPAV